MQYDFQLRSSGDTDLLIAHVAYRDDSALIGFNYEVTVEVGHHAALLSLNTDSSADDAFAGSIFHVAIDSNLLCKGTD